MGFPPPRDNAVRLPAIGDARNAALPVDRWQAIYNGEIQRPALPGGCWKEIWDSSRRTESKASLDKLMLGVLVLVRVAIL
jgi:hypothetical protein